MKPFLLTVAESLVKSRPDLENCTVVFPNRRAVLYFRKHLSSLLEKPVFAPRLITIEDFIQTFSSAEIPDKLELIHHLYKAYHEVVSGQGRDPDRDPEPFDKFYFWGDMLLRDFDELDKYLIDAGQLFRDLSNQKELDSSFDYLTAEQIEFLRSFWGNFEGAVTANKKKFLQVWRQLHDVYKDYKDKLRANGLAYEGMMHREVAVILEASGSGAELWKGGHLVFAGFNALTLAEEKIISFFVERGMAEVHWDMDGYYVNNTVQEAGRFLRQYQQHPVLGKTFPEDIPSHFSNGKTVKIAGAAQHIGQTKLMAQILSEQMASGIDPEDTLIVLPDEKLLLPVLHGISCTVEKLNVTMGFPLAGTPVYNLIEFLIELQANEKETHYNHRQVLSILGHPYVLAADPVFANTMRKKIVDNNKIMIHPSEMKSGPPLLGYIFRDASTSGLISYLREILITLGSVNGLTTLDKEYVFYFLTLVNRLEEVTGAADARSGGNDPASFQDGLKSFSRLFRQLVRSEKIPFTGEPLKGLQVMGVLETRNLDFKNVFVLSLNEGALPAAGNRGTYIPFNIRKAYGLPTQEHQDAFYAYLFYRVLQRAENIFLFYNTETDVLGQGEMSRYLQQLLLESGWSTEHAVLHNPIQPHPIKAIEIRKDESVLRNLAGLNEGNPRFKGISPSALNTYIECQLQFYFKHIARIKEAREVEEDLDARLLGNLLHEVMELFYRRIQEHKKTNLIEVDDLKHPEAVTEQLIDSVFIRNYSLDPGRRVIYEGQRLVVREVIKSFVERILEHDRKYAPFSIEGLETAGLLHYVPISHAPGQAVIGGKIDRVDRKGNVVRIIDYKTGRDKLDFQNLESLFVNTEGRNKAAFQTLLYALLYKSNFSENGLQIVPGLINRLNIFDEEFAFGLKVDKETLQDATPLFGDLERLLKTLLEEIFDPARTFKQTENLETCRFCPYQGICYR